MKKKKVLVVYYSRTGTTKKVAEAMAKQCNADIDEIIDLKNRKGPLNYLIAGKDAGMRNLTKIKTKKKPSRYSLVIIGTPIWNWKMAPAVRTYLTKNKFKKIAFFCTMGKNGDRKTFIEMGELNKKPEDTIAFTTKEVNEKLFEQRMELFLDELLSRS